MANIVNYKVKTNFYYEKVTDCALSKDTLSSMLAYDQHALPYYDAPEVISDGEYT